MEKKNKREAGVKLQVFIGNQKEKKNVKKISVKRNIFYVIFFLLPHIQLPIINLFSFFSRTSMKPTDLETTCIMNAPVEEIR